MRISFTADICKQPTDRELPVHQLRLNRLTSTASYQAFIGQITSPICPHCGSGEEKAEHLLLSCPRSAAERQHHFGDSIDINDVFREDLNLVEFLISGPSASPYRHWPTACHDDNNNSCQSDKDSMAEIQPPLAVCPQTD